MPPAPTPETSTVARSNKPTLSPSTFTVPPLCAAAVPDASRVPVTLTTPDAPPPSQISPLRDSRLRARITPSLLSTVDSNASLACAFITTRPPSATSEPELPARAPASARSTLKLNSPSRSKSRFTWSPAAIPMLPPGTFMLPVLLTCGAISATNSPRDAVILPALVTPAALPPLVKVYLPARKLLSEIPKLEATNPPTSTCAPGANKTPAGLVRKTWPLEVSRPKICDALPPSMRFRMTDFAPGWAKLTCAALPMLKLFQLTIAFADD